VRSLSVHQLTPELAEPIAQSQLTIFVDACFGDASVDSNLSNMKVCNVADLAGDLAELALAGMGHQFDPRSLLLLVQQVYGKNPVAYLLLLPAVNLDFGEKLSDITCQGVEQAVDFVKTLCTKLV
jgi:Ni,Fe-hydrogenase maturation factor